MGRKVKNERRKGAGTRLEMANRYRNLLKMVHRVAFDNKGLTNRTDPRVGAHRSHEVGGAQVRFTG